MVMVVLIKEKENNKYIENILTYYKYNIKTILHTNKVVRSVQVRLDRSSVEIFH